MFSGKQMILNNFQWKKDDKSFKSNRTLNFIQTEFILNSAVLFFLVCTIPYWDLFFTGHISNFILIEITNRI